MEQLSPQRPHPNIFSLYVFGSVLLQFGVHLAILIYLYNQAVAEMDPAERQAADADFAPNLVNTVTYLLNAWVQVTTFAVNYVGHPFTQSIKENKGLWLSVMYPSAFLFLLATGATPWLGDWFQLVVIPF